MSLPAEEVVRRTAALARLEITDADVQRLAPQFARILDAFRTIAAVDPGSAEAMTRVGSDAARTRPDEERASLPVERALANAPDRVDDYYSVPRTVAGPGERRAEGAGAG